MTGEKTKVVDLSIISKALASEIGRKVISDFIKKRELPVRPISQRFTFEPVSDRPLNPKGMEMLYDSYPTPKPAAQADQWDEATRGKKMSTNSGRVIYKYQMPIMERFTMLLPLGAEIIRVADQGGMFWLWAVVDTNVPDEVRHFAAVKCGANVPEGNLHYIGFCAIFVQQELGLYIFEDLGDAED